MKKVKLMIRMSEYVFRGHPDKLCDQISDAIVDYFIKNDPYSHVAVDSTVSGLNVNVFGEVLSEHKFSEDKIVGIIKKVITEAGYTKNEYGFTADNVEIKINIKPQSQEIAKSVGIGKTTVTAGDQGMMYGYAIDETDEKLHLPHVLSVKIAQEYEKLRKKIDVLRPDGKVMLTGEGYGDEFVLENVIIAAQHDDNIELEEIKEIIMSKLVIPILGKYMYDETNMYINNSGSFVKGGPLADSGLTGRKVALDLYGGLAQIGGGCPNGKDGTKVDRSATYYARKVAKELLTSQGGREALVKVGYVIGKGEPVCLEAYIDNKKVSVGSMLKDFSVENMIEELDLRRPVFYETAKFGHFINQNFEWEKD